jgi:hypothetical protein
MIGAFRAPQCACPVLLAHASAYLAHASACLAHAAACLAHASACLAHASPPGAQQREVLDPRLQIVDQNVVEREEKNAINSGG